MSRTFGASESGQYCPNCGSRLQMWGKGRKLCSGCNPELPELIDSHRGATNGTTGVPVEAIEREIPPQEAVASEQRGTVGPLLPPDSDVRPDVTFVFPTMNEEEGIATCIEWAVIALRDLDMTGEIIVSDSSTDRTPEIARELGAIVVNPPELGYGAAYQFGFRFARGEYIVMGDADCTYDFRALPRLLKPIREGDADMVMGSRFMGDLEPGAMPRLHQYVGNPLLTRFLNVFYGTDISDAHSGFRVFTREALEEFELRSEGMEFASEMVMDGTMNGLTIEEVPINYRHRKGEEKLNSFRDGWRHVKFMITNAPAYVYAVPGGIVAAVGMLLMTLSLFHLQPGPITFGTHTMILGSLCLIVGFQVWLLAPFSSIAGNPIRKSNDLLTRWIESRFRLEHGASLGIALTVTGVGYGGALVLQWFASSGSEIPFVPLDMLAFTAIVLGIETLFVSFYLSSLADVK